jgi:hypothetical protein
LSTHFRNYFILRFKEFIKLSIFESLNPAQKARVGIDKDPHPSENAMKLTKGMFPEGEDTTTIPLAYHNKQDVIDHLNAHGFSGHNYKAGTTKDKNIRTVSIGSVLKNKKTEAPATMIKGYTNDNRESTLSPETHDIMISRDKEKIASCSTNKGKNRKKGWKSCATITPAGRFTSYGGGVAARKIQASMEAGTITAELKKKGETNEDNSDARLLIHPYHTYDKDGNVTHSVLMPERKVYSRIGGIHTDFQRTMDDYCRKNNPMKEGKIYFKDSRVYNDTGEVGTIAYNTSPKSVKQILFGNEAGENNKKRAMKDVKLPHATISSILNEPRTEANHDNLGNAHRLIAKYQKLSSDNFDQLLKENHVGELAKNESLSKAQVKAIANHKITPTDDDNIDQFFSQRFIISTPNTIIKA